MKKGVRFTALFLALSVGYWSCSNDEKAVAPPVPGNEFLTTVRLVATNAADASDVQVASITDTTLVQHPADSINNHVLNLKAGAVYHVQVQFLDETKTPAGDVTAEIKERQNYHLICFNVDAALKLTVQRTDHDTNPTPLEVGLQDDITTGVASSGILNVQLRHQPNSKNGTCDPGSSDADVDFTVNVH